MSLYLLAKKRAIDNLEALWYITLEAKSSKRS